MSFVPDSSQLRGLSFPKASLYGMPHIGAKYWKEEMDATKWTGDYRQCACCGKVGGQHNRHHEPPRSNGTFLLETPRGKFVLFPALIDLCGSGTTGCHGKRTNGILKISWSWYEEEFAEAWWDGSLLSKPYHEPHGNWLWDYGRYVFEMDGKGWEVRR